MHAQVPGLAVVLVGSRKDSETYVRSKKKACAEVGIADFGVDLPEDATEQQVLEVRTSGTGVHICFAAQAAHCHSACQRQPTVL